MVKNICDIILLFNIFLTIFFIFRQHRDTQNPQNPQNPQFFILLLYNKVIQKTSRKPQYGNIVKIKTSKKPQYFLYIFYYLREKYYITI